MYTVSYATKWEFRDWLDFAQNVYEVYLYKENNFCTDLTVV